MIDALFSGISALNAFQIGLNSESNNLANTNTIGYKSDKISFSDMMYQNGIGKGVKVQTIDKNFNQGTIKVTGNNLDVAINGKGFFVLKGDSAETFFSRAGNFRIAEDGTLQNPDGYKVQGAMIDGNFSIVSSDSNITKITNDFEKTLISKIINNDKITSTFNALSTNYLDSARDDSNNLSGNGYKTRETKIADISLLRNSLNDAIDKYLKNPVDGTSATNQIATTSIPLNSFTTSYDEISIVIDGNTISQIFDTDAITTLKKFSDKISAITGISAVVDSSGNLTITNLNPGENKIISNNVKIKNINLTQIFNVSITQANEGSGFNKVLSIEQGLKSVIEKADAKYFRILNSLDTSNTTLSDIQTLLDKLNLSANPFGEIEINDGIIYEKQGDNRFVIGKISTVLFKDELSLEPKGDNLFSKTKDSGEPILATNENKLIGGAIELSNSEVGKSLVSLMVYQRAFEASSKSITTSDEFLKTAIQLKR